MAKIQKHCAVILVFVQITNKMKSSFTTQLLQASITCLTLFTTTSQGLTQSLSYVQGVALESSYIAPALPFTVKAVYGDFRNRSPIWVQLWKQGGDAFTHALVWQVKITPQVGDGTGEWVQIGPSSQITISDTYRLGLVNDVVPGPLLQQGDVTSKIILSVDDVGGRGTDHLDLEIGQEVTFDDLVFPYHIPLYLCNTSDCIFIRSHLGRAELPTNDTTMSVTAATDMPITATPRIEESDDGSENETPLALWIWLSVLSLILLIVILVLICVCALLRRRDRREGPYSHQIPTLSVRRIGEEGINNNGFERISDSTGSETSARIFARQGGLAEYATVHNVDF